MQPLRDYRSSTRGGSDESENRKSAKTIVAKVLEERSQGKAITDTQVLAANPELSEALRQELSLADQIRQAMLAARRSIAVHERLRSLTDSEFDASVESPHQPNEGKLTATQEDLPRIPGYLLVIEINRGGQAVVYQAIQESTGRKVAIKVMSGGPFVGSRHRVRFEREAKILAALDHPNIVSIIERGRTPDGSFFFVMQYIDGFALDDYWTTQISRDSEGLRKLVQLFSKIAVAVEEAHVHGVVHRDLKPSNIRVDQRGEPHILDFGLARPVDEACDLSARTITMPGQIIGSLPWASPEQAAGRSKELTAVSDVYSLGVILFQSLTGSFPYSLEGPIDEVLFRIRTFRPEAPSKRPQARVGVDRSLNAIVLRSLEKVPQERYRSAGIMAQDLESWIAGGPTLAMHAKPVHRGRSLAMTAILTACVAVSSVAAWKATRVSRPVVFELPALQNSIGMKLVRIPSGTFMMGSPENEKGRNDDEHQRRVIVDHSFYIATTETTQEQYERVMHDNPSNVKWRGSTMPVENVSWNQAVEFCRRLTALDHAHYRLPTETEYEYACRAMSTAPFPNPINPDATVWSSENSGGTPQPVAKKFANTWGLFDMQGNVQEWCEDVFYHDMRDDRDSGPPTTWRVLRGGSALSTVSNCRAASRSCASENVPQLDFGFRVVRDP